jgi:peptidyl-prolyl cis-trans isomerase C
MLDRHIPGRVVPFEAVRERIGEWLEEKVHRAAVRQYIGALAAAAEISGITLDDQSSSAAS